MAESVPFRVRREFPLLFGTTSSAESVGVVFGHENKQVAQHVMNEVRKVAFALFHLQVARAKMNRHRDAVLTTLAVALAAERGVGTDDGGVFRAPQAFRIVTGAASRHAGRLSMWRTRVKAVKEALLTCNIDALLDAYACETALRERARSAWLACIACKTTPCTSRSTPRERWRYRHSCNVISARRATLQSAGHPRA